MTTGSYQVCWQSFINNTGLESGGVIYFQDGNDDISWRLCLGMKSLDCRSSNGSASDERDSYLVFRFHGVLSDLLMFFSDFVIAASRWDYTWKGRRQIWP